MLTTIFFFRAKLHPVFTFKPESLYVFLYDLFSIIIKNEHISKCPQNFYFTSGIDAVMLNSQAVFSTT